MAIQIDENINNSDISLPDYTELGSALGQIEAFISSMRSAATNVNSFNSEGLDLNGADSEIPGIKTNIQKLVDDGSEINEIHQSLKDTIYLLTGINQEMQEQYGAVLPMFLTMFGNLSQDELFEISNEHAKKIEEYQIELNSLMGQIKAINDEANGQAGYAIDDLSSAYYEQFKAEQEKKLEPLYKQYNELYQIMYITKGFYEFSLNMAYNRYMQNSDFNSKSTSLIANYETRYKSGDTTDIWGADIGGYYYYCFTDKNGNEISPNLLEQAIYFYSNGKSISNPAGATSGQDLNNYYYDTLPYLTDDEIKIMTYLLNTGNQERIDEYLSLKKDEANQRHGRELANDISNQIDEFYLNNPPEVAYTKTCALLAGNGFVDGLGTFVSGIDNLFNADGKFSYKDYYTQALMEYLHGRYEDKRIAEIIATGSYEISSSIGNMAPSMIVSMIPGCQWAGLSLMGLSATGNAREEGLKLGMSDGGAWLYGILSGASEVVLERFLGAIPGLSNMERFAELGGLKGFLAKMVSEGTEESLQAILDPLFATIATNGKIPYEVDWGEVLKSGIYGMITAGTLNAATGVVTISVEGITYNIATNNVNNIIEEFQNKDLTNPEIKRQLMDRLSAIDTTNRLSGLNINENQTEQIINRLSAEEVNVEQELNRIRKENRLAAKNAISEQMQEEEKNSQIDLGKPAAKIKNKIEQLKAELKNVPTKEDFEEIAKANIFVEKSNIESKLSNKQTDANEDVEIDDLTWEDEIDDKIQEKIDIQSNEINQEITPPKYFSSIGDIADYFGDENLYLYSLLNDKIKNNKINIGELSNLRHGLYLKESESIDRVLGTLTQEEKAHYNNLVQNKDNSIQGKWISNLSESEKMALRSYAEAFGSIDSEEAMEYYGYDSHGEPVTLNDLMRLGFEEGSDNIDSAIEKFGTLPDEIVTHRGSGISSLTSQFGEITPENVGNLVGKVFHDKAYLSTSLLEIKARAAVGKKTDVLFNITVPTDANYGAYIESQSHVSYGQLEFLIKKDSSAKIEKAYINDDGKIVVEMRLFNPTDDVKHNYLKTGNLQDILWYDKLSNEGKKLLQQQIKEYNSLKESSNANTDGLKFSADGKLILKEGTLIHGTNYNAETIKSIARDGIVSGQLLNIDEDGETFFCADFFRVNHDTTASEYFDYVSNKINGGFTFAEERKYLPSRKLVDTTARYFGDYKIGFVVDPTEELHTLLSQDPYRDNETMKEEIVNWNGIKDFPQDRLASILVGVPANGISAVVVGNGISADEIELISQQFPGRPVVDMDGRILNNFVIEDKELAHQQEGHYDTDELVKELERLGFNNDAIQFFIRNDIDYDEIMDLDEGRIIRADDINPIVYEYGMYYSSEEANVSVADIIGRNDVDRGKNLLSTLAMHFDSNGSGYEQRSIGMLEYRNGEDMIRGLKESFRREPMHINEVENGKYIMGSNGMHRFTLLRIHYLNELLKGKISKTELRNKYIIPVELNRVNYFRTYSNFILREFGKDTSDIWNVYEDNGKISESLKLEFMDGTSRIISENDLKNMVESTLLQFEDYELRKIKYYYDSYSSFKQFIDGNFPEISEKLSKIEYIW